MKNLIKVTILGATGSIGQSTIKIIKDNLHIFSVTSLIANSNAYKLIKLAFLVNAKYIVCYDTKQYHILHNELDGTNIKFGVGESAALEAINLPADIIVAGISGAAGIKITLESMKPNRILALANKECMVIAGRLFMNLAKINNIKILPIDSEHNAIFQILDTNNLDKIEKIILTASGGPFNKLTLKEMEFVQPKQALQHPNWKMGPKITIDSSTLMNKGFEIIEAYYLFKMNITKIDVIIHPESIIHGLIQYLDGSLLAQLSTHDMRVPISYCLFWPKRLKNNIKRIKLEDISNLTFQKPDFQRFPALKLSKDALKYGNVATIALNAADEIAINAFLKHQINFLEIIQIIKKTITNIIGLYKNNHYSSIEEILNIDKKARSIALKYIINS